MQYVTYIHAKVLAEFPEEVPPDESVAVNMVECFVFRMFLGGSPHRDVCQAYGVRAIIDGIIEVFVPGKARYLSKLFADQHVES